MTVRRSSTRSETPVDAQKKALLQQEEELDRAMKAIREQLEEIPRQKAVREKARQTQTAKEKADRGTVLPPPTHAGYTVRAVTGQTLRREKRYEMVKLMALVMVLVGIVLWIWMLKP